MVLLIVDSSGQENVYQTCGFLGYSISVVKKCLYKLWFYWYFFHVSKKMLIQTVVFLVFGSPVSLRHAGEPLASCPRLHGNAKTKKTIVFISISVENIIKD